VVLLQAELYITPWNFTSTLCTCTITSTCLGIRQGLQNPIK